MKFTTKTEEIKLNKINLMTEEQKEKNKEYQKQYREANKNKLKAKAKEYYQNNKDKIKEYQESNKDNNKEKSKQYRVINKEILKEKNIEYRKNNKEKIIKTQKEFRERNKIKLKEYQKQYMKNRLNSDIVFKIKQNIRSLISFSIKSKGFKKNSKTEDILGCTFEEFKIHLESLFLPWMHWKNYGNPADGILEFNKTWDLDHIVPISSATTEEEVIKLNHFTNLQPLCSKINRQIKQNKIYFKK